MALIPLAFIIMFLLVIVSAIIIVCLFIKKHGNKNNESREHILKQLENYQNLLDNGFITAEEFEQKKRELIESRGLRWL